MRFDWDSSAVVYLTRRCAEGDSAGVIAKDFGLTRNAIIGKVKRLGLVLNPSTVQHNTLISAPPRRIPPTPYCKPRPARPRPARPKPQRGFPKVPECSRPCTILGLTAATCRWPLWRDKARFGDEDYGIYCGGIVLEGLQYCAHHAHIAWGR